MTRHLLWAFTAAALLVAACVTINVYFPEAAVEAAADRIIDEVRGKRNGDAPSGDNGTSWHPAPRPRPVALALLELLVPAAQAQGNTDFNTSSPAKRQLEASLKRRYRELEPYYDSGAIGFTSEATIEIRDRSLIPLNERNRVRQLVSEQNADWEALYQEIARINDHPEWRDNIRQVFAERWIAKAERGWYYRTANGTWRQK